jgi:hypothetical protein
LVRGAEKRAFRQLHLVESSRGDEGRLGCCVSICQQALMLVDGWEHVPTAL